MNELLRRFLLQAGLREDDVAARLILQRHLGGLSGMMLPMVMELAADELGRVHERISATGCRLTSASSA